MKLRRKTRKKSLANQYEALADHGKRHIRRRPYLFPIFGFLLGIGIVWGVFYARGGKPYQPSDSHVVFLFDQGKQQTLDTKAKTVGDLVEKLPLNLISQDVIEPSLDTKIVEDNFRVNIYRARPVTVIDKGKRTVTITTQKSPRVVAQDAGLTVYPEDIPAFAQGSLKENVIGEKVEIDRAVPMFLNLYGTPLKIRTHALTVADLLKEKNIVLSEGDTVKPVATTGIGPNTQVFVTRKGTKIVTKKVTVAAPVKIVSDSSLTLGASATRQKGSPGKKAVTYLIKIKNGKEVGRKIIQQVVISDPVPTIIARGTHVQVAGDKTSWMQSAGISGGDFGYVNYIVSHESNWSPSATNGATWGLCQALPGSKMASAGADWQTNPVTQLKWCTGYASGTYGSWNGAYNFWVSHGYW